MPESGPVAEWWVGYNHLFESVSGLFAYFYLQKSNKSALFYMFKSSWSPRKLALNSHVYATIFLFLNQ